MNFSTATRFLQRPESSQGENRLDRVGCPDSKRCNSSTARHLNNQLSDPPIGVHDRFDQQSKALELSKIEVFDSLVKTTINPITISFLIDREVLIERLTPNAVSESVVMQKLSGVKLQRHASRATEAVSLARSVKLSASVREPVA